MGQEILFAAHGTSVLTVTQSEIKKSLPPTAAAASHHSLRDLAPFATFLRRLALWLPD
jgi:hypothetical protein